MGEILQPPKLVDIHYRFAETEHGRYLGAQMRWDKYRRPDITPERWQKLLGIDANNLHHGKLMGAVARQFIRSMNRNIPGYFDEVEAAVLEVGGYIHDWGEADESTGDVNFFDKTVNDTEREKMVFEAHLKRYFPDKTNEIHALLYRALDEVIYTKDTKLGQAFNAVEHIGYVRTGLRAAQLIARGTVSDCQEELRWLTADVLSNNPKVLIDYAQTYPPVLEYTLNHRDRISDAFDIAAQGEDVFLNYPPEVRYARLLDFESNRQAWHQWVIRQELGL